MEILTYFCPFQYETKLLVYIFMYNICIYIYIIYDCVTHIANSYKFTVESESNTSTTGGTDRDIFKESQLILNHFFL